MLEEVKIKLVTDLTLPKFIKPKAVIFERNATAGMWEMVKQHDSVHVLVDNTETEELLLVRQVRIPVLVNNPNTTGEVVECCAGILDKGLSPKETAIAEIQEELGYMVFMNNISEIRSLKSSVGTAGSTSHAFYATTTETGHVGQNLGEGEDIDIVRIPYDAIESTIETEPTDAITLFLLYWWMRHHG